MTPALLVVVVDDPLPLFREFDTAPSHLPFIALQTSNATLLPISTLTCYKLLMREVSHSVLFDE
jgi:hypothetical protein